MLLILLACWLGGGSARAQVATYFTDKHGTFTGVGSYWYQQFTLQKQQTFVLRVASDYAADAGIVTAAQLQNFISNQSFTGHAIFDNQYGTKTVTLAAGTYYVAIRSQSANTNAYRLELDHDITLPPETNRTYTFVDHYIQGTEFVNANGGKLWHGFTVQQGFRYFIDGCNTGLSTFIIPASELSAFQAGQTFNYYTAYSGEDNAYPGLHELVLPPGGYYLAFLNTNSIPKPVTYTMERWRVNEIATGGSIDLSGTTSWSAKNGKLTMKVGKIANLATSGKSGSLRLRVWAVKSKFAGGKLVGHILGTQTLKPLSAGKQYTKIKAKVSFAKPPSGRYYSVLTLEENTKTGWKIRDYVGFTNTLKF